MTLPARGPRGPVVRPAARRHVPAPRRAPEQAPVLSPRDRAVLLAVVAGRCTMSPDSPAGMLVDGRPCTDQFAGHRLLQAGLARLVIQPPGRPCVVEPTPAAIELLGLPITI